MTKKPSARSVPSVAPATSSVRPGALAAILVFGATLAYLNSFQGQFMFDDDPSIVDNPGIRNLAKAWAPPEAGGLTVSGRPLLSFSFALNYAVSGLERWSYHLLNLAIHVGAGLLLAGLVRRTLQLPSLAGRWADRAGEVAFFSAGLWLLHPLQTESVTYVVQRAESLVALCFLGTWWFFVRAATEPARRVWAVAAVLTCAAGMAAKEVMATAPLVLLVYDRLFLSGSWREVWRQRGPLHLALAGTWLVLAWLVISTGGRGGTAGFGTAMSSWDYLRTQFYAIAHYLRLVVWPSPLVLDYGTALVTEWSRVGPAAALVLGLAGLCAWGTWRGMGWGFCGMFFFVVLGPSSSVVPVVTQTMAEHRTYLPLAGPCVLVAAAGSAWLGRRAWGVFGALMLVLGALTFLRNADYSSRVGMYEDIAAKQPRNARALALLADYHQREGDLDAAQRWLERSVALEPSLEALNNLGNVVQRRGDVARAQTLFEQALRLKPADPTTLSNLGNALVAQGRLEEAIGCFEEALRSDPKFSGARFNLANTLAQGRRFSEAVPHYRALVELTPDDAEAHANFAGVLGELGQRDEAIVAMAVAVRLRPQDAMLHNTLGVMLARSGRLREALENFEAATRLQPAVAEYQRNAALAAQRLGLR